MASLSYASSKNTRYMVVYHSLSDFISLYNRDYRILKPKFDLDLHFTNIKFNRDTLIGKVASILNQHFANKDKEYKNMGNYLYNMLNGDDSIKSNFVSNTSFWLYTTKKENYIPKNDAELENVNKIMMKIINTDFDGEENTFLNNNLSHCVAFMIMFLTTRNYYYIDNVNSFTVRKGKRQIWTCPLLQKELKPIKKQEKKEYNKYKSESFRKESLLPRQLKEKDELKEKITNIIIEIDPSFDKTIFNEFFILNRSMNNYLDTRGKFYVGNNRSKKLNKLYQDYQKISKIIVKSKSAGENCDSIVTDSGNTITFKKVRKNHSNKSAEEFVSYDVEEDLEKISNDESTPDCWESIDLEDDNTAW